VDNSGDYEKAIGYSKALRKRQRRFEIEILIAACFICLLVGFVAGASWHYVKVSDENTATSVKSIETPIESRENDSAGHQSN